MFIYFTYLIVFEVLIQFQVIVPKKIDLNKIDQLLLNFKDYHSNYNKEGQRNRKLLFSRKQADNTTNTNDSSAPTNSTSITDLTKNHSETDILEISKNTTDLTIEVGGLEKSIESLNKTIADTNMVRNSIKIILIMLDYYRTL